MANALSTEECQEDPIEWISKMRYGADKIFTKTPYLVFITDNTLVHIGEKQL